MRKGESLSLTRSDIDFETKTIAVRALTTKTLQARPVPISGRLLDHLRALYERFQTKRETVFGISVKFQHSWESACGKAGIADLRFHDLRLCQFCGLLIVGSAVFASNYSPALKTLKTQNS